MKSARLPVDRGSALAVVMRVAIVLFIALSGVASAHP